MRETIRQLADLQALEITLQESAIVHGDQEAAVAQTRDLQAEVDELRLQINSEVLARYDRLRKHGPSIVKVNHNMCMSCNLMIPQGDLNRIETGKAEPICPHCGVFLDL